jgi:polysaccharide pyruvyl transferase WcaK-like protein
MNFLIGTVPYGKDNVGDEAILASIVCDIKTRFPNDEITISTGTPEETAKKFSVRTVPLFGLYPEGNSRFGFTGITPLSKQLLVKEMKRTDVYVWGGATGLSDYPDYGIYVADIAKKFSKILVLYSVAMNSELTPMFYKVSTGRKKKLLDLCRKLTFNCVNFVHVYENCLEKRIKKKIKRTLNKADLIIIRDNESRKEIEKCGVTQQIHTTSDPAILLKPVSQNHLEEIWKEQSLWNDNLPIVGVGISSQRMIEQTDNFVLLLNFLVNEKNVNILFLPMNPITDAQVMKELHKKMNYPERAKILTGFFEPEEMIAVTSRLSLVISSRLHLLILASINFCPLIGLSRGSKIASYLSFFGEKDSGTVESFKLEAIKDNCSRLLRDRDIFMEKSKKIVHELQSEAKKNINHLRLLIDSRESNENVRNN